MTESVAGGDVTWLRIPFPAPIADATHTIEVLDLVVLELRDAAGHVGTSYMLGFDYATDVLFAMAIDAANAAVGSAPSMRNETWWAAWDRYEYVGREGIAAWGVGLVDLALWDLYGHQVGQPVWALLGGRAHGLPSYGSGGWLTFSKRELIEEAFSYLAKGLGGYKMKVGRGVEEDVDRIRAVRRELGPDVPLMIDANQGLTLSSARRLSAEVEDLCLRWFEEPLPTNQVANYVKLRATSGTPLAMGERAFYPRSMLDIMQRGGVDVLMPDALRIGGVRGWLDLASLASAHDLEVAPHYYREFDIAIGLASNKTVFIENFFWTDVVFDWPATYSDGFVTPPDQPGFGLTLKQDAREKYTVRQSRVANS